MKKAIGVMISVFLLLLMAACQKTEENGLSSSVGQTESDNLIEPTEDNEKKETMQESENAMTDTGIFNFETKTVMLNSGYEMPLNGIGTYSLTDEVCVESVSTALEKGVRLIDTAYMYHNE